MAILLLFEKTDCLSYKELHLTTKIADDQFPRYVQSLLDAKLLNCNTEVSCAFEPPPFPGIDNLVFKNIQKLQA